MERPKSYFSRREYLGLNLRKDGSTLLGLIITSFSARGLIQKLRSYSNTPDNTVGLGDAFVAAPTETVISSAGVILIATEGFTRVPMSRKQMRADLKAIAIMTGSIAIARVTS